MDDRDRTGHEPQPERPETADAEGAWDWRDVTAWPALWVLIDLAGSDR